ncbi:mannonate dehydratase [Bacillus sp. FSL R7-0672]
MGTIVKALYEEGFAGYGLYDRALGAMYLQGIWEGLHVQTRKGKVAT